MGLFENFFEKKKKESALLIDAGTNSVGGAYASFVEGELPTLVYTRRFPVEMREGESEDRAMLRALNVLADTLVSEGAPALARSIGSGSAHRTLVSLDAPWQRTAVRSETFEKAYPFVFTEDLVRAALAETRPKATEKLLVDEHMVGARLNGYETLEPYGKKVNRASVIILTSLMDKRVATGVTGVLRKKYHAENVRIAAGSALRLQAIRSAFPHEHDALIVDATSAISSIALIRKGLFAAIDEVSGAPAEGAWMEQVKVEFAELAKQYPLPRTIFLLSPDADAASLRKAFAGAELEKLWLSDNPPKVVSVLPNHLSGLVRQVTTAAPDLRLMLMALFLQGAPRHPQV